MKKEQITTPVKPYDYVSLDRWDMYDNMPYIWDSDLLDTKRLNYVSGNIIKAYRCQIKEPYEVKH